MLLLTLGEIPRLDFPPKGEGNVGGLTDFSWNPIFDWGVNCNREFVYEVFLSSNAADVNTSFADTVGAMKSDS